MKGKVFVDTNVWVYSQDHTAAEKQEYCRQLLYDLQAQAQLVLSTQVLQEFYNVMTRKANADPIRVKSLLQQMQAFELAVVDVPTINHAIDISILTQISFWDALLFAAAAQLNCSSVLTEDLNHGQLVNGIRVVNPFKIRL
jgi:predicted nucleic acid-binding protein